MDFKKYEDFCRGMPDFDDAALGLPGEVGEVLELIKKDRRTGEYRQPLDLKKFKAELGDLSVLSDKTRL
jgi:NTP pyrophosphatase (non-canonical NTP hydrolase)